MENGQRTRQRRDNRSSPGDIPPDQLSAVSLKFENPGGSAGTGDARKWGALISVAFGAFLATLDSSIVNVSIPAIMADFGSNLTDIEWVVTAYMLAFAVLMPLTAWLRDRIGHKLLFSMSLAVTGIISTLSEVQA